MKFYLKKNNAFFEHYYAVSPDQSGITHVYAPGLRTQFTAGPNMREDNVISESPVSIVGKPTFTETSILLKLKSEEGWYHSCSEKTDLLPVLAVEFPLEWKDAILHAAYFLYNHSD